MARRSTKAPQKNENTLTFQESIEYMMNPREFFESHRDKFRKMLEKRYGRGVDQVEFEMRNLEDDAKNRAGMDSDKVKEIVDGFVKAAYKRMYGTDENCHVIIANDFSRFDVYMKQIVVEDDDCADRLLEIPLTEAKNMNPDAEVGDEMLTPIDPSEFNRIAMMSGKQRCKQETRDFTKNTILSAWKNREHKIVNGEVVRVDYDTNDIYIDFGSNIEGRLTKSHQIPGEMYDRGDKIKVYVEEVRQTERGMDVVLSRTSSDLVRILFELQVPEISDGVVEIFKVSRKAGYRSKVAVYTNTPEVDPVGACVGVQGARITAVMNEISGEKIDIVPYDPDPKLFITASLAPATIQFVKILDTNTRRAIAVVDESQLAYAIGRGGENVRLANKLTDWLVDIKTVEQYSQLDIAKEEREDVERLFQNTDEGTYSTEYENSTDKDDEISAVESQDEGDEEYYFEDYAFLPSVIEKVKAKGINSINDYFNADIDDVNTYFGFTPEEEKNFNDIIQSEFSVEDEE